MADRSINPVVCLGVMLGLLGGASTVHAQAAGPLLWLRADVGVSGPGSQVSSWADQSGHGNNAAMGTSTRQPTLVTGALNGLPVIRFGGSQSLVLTTPASPQNFTIFIVGKNSTQTEDFSMILGPGGSSPNNQIRWDDGIHALFVGTGNALPTTTVAIGNTRQYHILAVRYNGSSMTVYRDGVAMSTTSFTTTGPFTLAQVGAWYSTYFMIGDLAEILIYSSALTDTDLNQTTGYLRGKYFSTRPSDGVTAGSNHSCALGSAGDVRCWGYNAHGEVGDGTTINRTAPLGVVGLSSGVQAVSSGYFHTCALAGGGVKCWGFNGHGELGDGTTTTRLTPANVVGLSSGVVALTTNYEDTCALTSVGTVKCWGFNQSGELGDGTTTQHTTPFDVTSLGSGVKAIGMGGGFACAITSAGGVKCWGYNTDGELGNGTTTQSLTPTDVIGLTSGVATISMGDTYACALTTGGGVKCWGSNPFGELGNGTTAQSTTPVDVVGLTSGVAAITTGNGASCALTAGGGVKCWGYNAFGNLGDGTNTDRSAPVDVVGLTSGVAALGESNGAHICARMSSGGVKCWGYNGFGELGNGTTTATTTPVSVVGF